ncbi:hypothetical protein TNCV_3582251 [Trichonephila clavipes]|nr:hypothetical protein TNCV_3582251 [Trichonephila clavipes]
MEWLIAQGTAARCPPKYKQNEDEQLSLFMYYLIGKKSNGMRSGDLGGHRTRLHVQSSDRSMTFQANYV